MRTKGYKCYNIKCGSCVGKTLCGEPDDVALGCVDRRVNTMTNADRIRAMSDEELVEWLSKWCRAAEDCRVCPICDCPHKRNETWLDWLQQPCESVRERATSCKEGADRE